MLSICQSGLKMKLKTTLFNQVKNVMCQGFHAFQCATAQWPSYSNSNFLFSVLVSIILRL